MAILLLATLLPMETSSVVSQQNASKKVGIWSESRSFSDDGLGPVPSKWKGTCQTGQEFKSNLCNRKIIGARWYDGHLKPKDLEDALMTLPSRLMPRLLLGRFVFCYNPAPMTTISPIFYTSKVVKYAKEAGAKGIILATYAFDMLDAFEICGSMPCVLVDFDVATGLYYALVQNTELVVKVTPALTWVLGNGVLAPKISTFSSRGPSPLFPKFLKPDVAAPGSNILAAVKYSYTFKSGTSMACPHVSGVAALLKALHPDWSPAIIKSAIVTIASNDRFGLPILADGLPQRPVDPFDYGGGFIDLNRAVDPGLAYDVDQKDYIPFHDCFLAGNSSCESESRNLNIPSIAILNLKEPTTVLRTVTNVGQADAIYKAVVQSPPGMQILVEPSILKFSAGMNKQSFKVTFTTTHKVQGNYLFVSLAWHDGGAHYVKTPIAVRPVLSNNYYSDV
uniref:Subtilisin-like protease fibronectin type-III domain-containing protein n=1 Tax=Oryza barthii TaxID=65489 RepID=A0A0D3FS59_9ORYZ